MDLARRSYEIMGDHGIVKGDTPTGTIAVILIVFNSIALYNVIELTFIIWTTFKRHGGLYFWSFIVSTYGIAIYSVGFLLMNSKPYWQSWFYATLVAVGWPMMVTGQSVVLYSRLHLLVLDRRVLKAVLYMIIIDAIIAHIPTIVFIYGANAGKNPQEWVPIYSAYEKVQVTIFFLQETIISAIYIWETSKTIKLQRELRDDKLSRRLLKHLLFINVLIICFDITILGLEYASIYDVQTCYKALVYAVKLKLEFSILNKLVEATTSPKELSGTSHVSTTAGVNAIGFPIDAENQNHDHLTTPQKCHRRRPNASYRASIRGGSDVPPMSIRTSHSQDDASSIVGVVRMTREVVVRRDQRGDTDGDSIFDTNVWSGADEPGSGNAKQESIPMEDIEADLRSSSQLQLSLGTWPDDGKGT